VSKRSNTLTARSVLLSVLLGTDPPRLPVRRLVRTTQLFGIAEGTTRTALSRMAAAGEVEADDGWYGLASDRLLARQARQAASRRAETAPWDGSTWRQVAVVADAPRSADARAGLRAALAGARLAELREGLWLRPDNLGDLAATVPAGVGDGLHWFRACPDADPAALAARLWPLDAWVARATQLVERMAGLVGPLEAGAADALADGFVLSADVLRHVQADPLLPPPLLPADWPGTELRTAYDHYDRAYRATLATWLAATD
jgi:phenylacetic acid degradation operon negative regulatory protein